MNPKRRHVLRSIAATVALPKLAVAGEGGAARDVVFLDAAHPDFGRRRTIFNKRITLTPKVIALCAAETGVVKAVEYAKKEGLPVAIRSGGHCFEGFSLNEGGLVIDLSPMDTLSLAADRTLRAGPGCRLSNVSGYLVPRGRLLPAGTCGGVGLSGLTLGGGYGFFSRKFGLTCDSLRHVRLVDGEGRIHDSADAPDLLWACRGGGTAGLGIVTQLGYVTHPAPRMLHAFRYRHRIATPEDALALAKRWADAMRGLPAEAYSAFVANTNVVTIVLVSFLPNARDARLLKIAGDLEKDAIRADPPRSDSLLAGVRRFVGQKGPLHFRNVSGGFYNTIDELGTAAAEIFEAVLRGPGIIFQINTFGPLPAAPDSAFPHRDSAFIGELQAYWEKPAAAARAMETIARLQRSLAAAGIGAHYANYPDVNLADWATSYYGAPGYRRLRAIKARLDPANLFRHPQSIEP